jgi:hypothetical protein
MCVAPQAISEVDRCSGRGRNECGKSALMCDVDVSEFVQMRESGVRLILEADGGDGADR